MLRIERALASRFLNMAIFPVITPSFEVLNYIGSVAEVRIPGNYVLFDQLATQMYLRNEMAPLHDTVQPLLQHRPQEIISCPR